MRDKWGVSLTLEGMVHPELSAAECSGGGTDEGEGDASQHTVSGGLVPAVGCLEVKGRGGVPAATRPCQCATSDCHLLCVFVCVHAQ